MSWPDAPWTTQAQSPAPAQPDRAARLRPMWRPTLVDAGIVLVWFLVLGVLAAVAWWQLVDLPRATRTDTSIVVEADQLGMQVNIDGWFVALALGAGLVSGAVLMLWRRRDPLLMVVLVTLGGGLATVVMSRLGRVLGPDSEVGVLRRQAEGAQAPLPLELHASGALWVWPLAAALGAAIYLWVLKDPESD